MGNCFAGSVLCPTAVSCRRPRSRGKVLAPPTPHPWTRKTTTPDLTIITNSNTDTAALITSMSSVVKQQQVWSMPLHGCLHEAIKRRKLGLANWPLAYLFQTEWEFESWAGAGTVEAEVKLSVSFALHNIYITVFRPKFYIVIFKFLCSHKSSSVQKETPKKKLKLEMKPSNGDRYDTCLGKH